MNGKLGSELGRSAALATLLWVVATHASAVPSFARQTGQECAACHVSWPELTPYGRFFKATGYTIGPLIGGTLLEVASATAAYAVTAVALAGGALVVLRRVRAPTAGQA